MDFFTILSEDKIKQAIKEGEFKQLPGMGKPLRLEDLSHIPPELRISYKILKNANMMNEDIELKKAIHTLEQLIAQCPDEMEKEKLQVQLNEKAFQLDKVLKKRNTFSSRASAFYKDQIFSKWF